MVAAHRAPRGRAVAREAGLEFSYERINAINQRVPFILNLKPSGKFTSDKIWSAGGVYRILQELREFLHLDALTVTGLTLGENLDVLERTGHQGTGSDMANSFAHYGHRISGPQVGAIAVMGRRGGGHVGIITGVDARGNPIMISGNNGNRVREAPISRGRIYAYVMPD